MTMLGAENCAQPDPRVLDGAR